MKTSKLSRIIQRIANCQAAILNNHFIASLQFLFRSFIDNRWQGEPNQEARQRQLLGE